MVIISKCETPSKVRIDKIYIHILRFLSFINKKFYMQLKPFNTVYSVYVLPTNTELHQSVSDKDYNTKEGLGRLEVKLASRIRELEKQNMNLQKKLRFVKYRLVL